MRVDINELWEMDIHDCVYAYTPLCTSNPETKGYMVNDSIIELINSFGHKDIGTNILEENHIILVHYIK